MEGSAGCVRSQQSDKVGVVVRWDRYGDRVRAAMKLAQANGMISRGNLMCAEKICVSDTHRHPLGVQGACWFRTNKSLEEQRN